MNKIMNRAEIYDFILWKSFFCSSNPAFITSDCTHITSTKTGKRSLFFFFMKESLHMLENIVFIVIRVF